MRQDREPEQSTSEREVWQWVDLEPGWERVPTCALGVPVGIAVKGSAISA